MRSVLPVIAALLSWVGAPGSSPAQDSRTATEAIIRDYMAAHPDEVGAIVRDYFIKHPEAVGQILAELMKHRSSVSASASAAARPGPDSGVIRANAAELYASPHQVTLGDPQGEVTLVEFFDYNCGFCKRALVDTLALLRDEPRLKLVLKEFPILGPGSTEAARVAIAARMQDPAKYLAFHQELLGAPGVATEQKALDAAKDQGFDMARLAKDMTSDEVAITIGEDTKLASALGISGTPSYVIGKDVIVGAIGADALKAHIKLAREASRSAQ
ncbi:MAG: DsbA family protein [Bradyrhizobium sp.]|uniref:DsbA family protein n=1 Tax=Bradyrhizobium sp. TaxID=376 RepID=UPI001DCF4EFA|nr:DsbA family protein [Bradyrhizobium sp.]MBV9559391.1 DsbA family protein [Bradyrhizobium sp.]